MPSEECGFREFESVCRRAKGHAGNHSIFSDLEKPVTSLVGWSVLPEPVDDGVRQYYGGPDNPYEAIKVIEAWGLGFCLGTVVKYISRCGKKLPLVRSAAIEDLIKARWYLDREIQNLQKETK